MRRAYLGIVFALCLIPANLSAGTAYNNFGPGNTVGVNAWIFTNASGFIATTFTTTGAGPLSSVLLDAGCSSTPITLGLYTNSAGQPGTLLESWTVPVTTVQLITLTSVLNPVLSSGTQYWFVITIPSNSTIEWAWNNQGVNGGVWLGSGINALNEGSSPNPTPVIQLNTQNAPNGTPLPPTLILTLCGLALLGLASFAVNLTGTLTKRPI